MPTNVEWPMVSAVAASMGVIAALVYYVKNLRLMRLSNSAKMVFDLVSIFNSAEMRKHRRLFAGMLLGSPSDIDLQRESRVLEFFEEIGYMTRRKVLDEGMVWNSFSWWLEPYYLAVTGNPNIIEEARSETQSPALYREIEWLYGRMCSVSKKEQGQKKYIRPSSHYVREFMEEEAKLDSVQA